MPKQSKTEGGLMNVDFGEMISRLVKYSLEGLVVAVAAFWIPKFFKGTSPPLSQIGMIGLVALATFAILDTYAPSVGSSARTGAGFGIGASLVGFPGGGIPV
jgi:hypothetical protein